jgi:hypothetical protein
MNLKSRLAILSVPAILAVGGGAVAVHASSTPPPLPAASQTGADTEKPDATEPAAAAEATGAPEQADPAGAQGTGHADPAGEVDHQATGNE